MARNDGRKLIRVRTKGSPSMVADMATSMKPELSVDFVRELARLVNIETDDLFSQYERFGVRRVKIGEFLGQMADQGKPAGHIMRCFEGEVLIPLTTLYKRIVELQEAVVNAQQQDLRATLRDAASQEPSNFEKMLAVFEGKVEGILAFDQEDILNRQRIRQSIAEVNRWIDQGSQSIRKVTGEGLDLTLHQLVSRTVRELADANHPLATSKRDLEGRWQEIEALVSQYHLAMQSLETAKKQYDIHFGHYACEFDAMEMYEGERARLVSVIRYAEEFFKAADLDPFELSNLLADIGREKVFTIPDVAGRQAIKALSIAPFPTMPESRTMERAQNVVKDIVGLIEAMELQPLLKPSECPVELSELAVCAYAVFVARYASGKPHPKSGRTIDKAYQSIVYPSGYSYGCTPLQFREAVELAEKKGLMQHFNPSKEGHRPKKVYQPTLRGFEAAIQLAKKFPPEFSERVFAAAEKLRQEQDEARRQFKEKKAQSQKSGA